MNAGLQTLVDDELVRLRRARTDLQNVEVKAARGGLPRSAKESVVAFSNAGGGLLILGLSDGDFLPVGVDAARLAQDLASSCADDMDPPVRAEIDIVEVDGMPVVAALVQELPVGLKPCYVKRRGLDGGAFVRTHDGDRRLSSYEVHVMVASRGQPRDDMSTVKGAARDDLDERLVDSLLNRIRQRRGPALADQSDESVLAMLGVLARSGAGSDESEVTLAGLLALGRYPQQFVPQLNVTFVAMPTVAGEPMDDGTRFLDNESLDGPIPAIVAAAQAAVRRNTTRRAVVDGTGRLDRWEYPDEAVREIVVNALMHRDYHPGTHGAQVRMELYPDRLTVTSPGGLHGLAQKTPLLAEPVTSSRNSRLAKLLEDVEVPRTSRTVCENRGTGLLAVAAALRAAGQSPPELSDRVRDFVVTIRSSSPPERRRPVAYSSGSALRQFDIRSIRSGAEVAASRPDPRSQIRELLAAGPMSAKNLADAMSMSRQAALKWLRRMEDAGEVAPTEPLRRTPLNKWRLGPSAEHAQAARI